MVAILVIFTRLTNTAIKNTSTIHQFFMVNIDLATVFSQGCFLFNSKAMVTLIIDMRITAGRTIINAAIRNASRYIL